MDETTVRALAGVLAAASTHPLSVALAAQAPGTAAPVTLVGVEERPGLGVEGCTKQGGRYRLGARAWIAHATPRRASAAAPRHSGPETWLGGPDGALACFRIAEALRPDARASVDLLRASGLSIELLSGDASSRVEEVARELGVARCRGDASPADKLAAVAALQVGGHRVAMVGDGLNDAPVMARADVSFAIGDGPALTRSHADFVLLSGMLADVAAARAIAQRAMRVVRQNLAWAIAYNAICVPVALLGWFPPWAAGLGMATSSLVVVVNALRIDPGPRARPVPGTSAP
jgi:Cu2+-exporting ATPase